MKTLQLKDNFYWAGIIDKDLRVFDIIMYTEFGTTYNSYVLKAGDKTILFETAKAKFTKDYEEALANIIDVNAIDYIVVDHTEPDHAGSIGAIVEKCPSLKVIATPAAIGFLKQIVNRDFYSIPVKNGQEIKIGDKTLRFYSLPNLHWPDSMYTYIVEDKTLVTCDSFGSHYAHEDILKSTVTDEEGYMRATKYYFDNILGPFKNPYLTNALKVVKSLDVDMICPGHGPVLDTDLDKLIATYDEWCEIPEKIGKSVVIPYVSAYGYTGQLAEAIAKGIKDSGEISVSMYDMVTADAAEVTGAMAVADGILFGTPTILQEALKPIWDLVTSMFPGIHGGKWGGAFGSYGWSGEGVPHITERLKQINMKVVDGYRVRFKPSEKDLMEAEEFGYRFGANVLDKIKVKKGGTGELVKCLVCGEIFDASIEVCPVCGVGKENFVEADAEMVTYSNNTDERFVILGGGTAALNSAKAIRARNKTASIVMLSEEKDLPYDRPMLTKNMFAGTDKNAFATEKMSWYEDNEVDIILDAKVTKLDTDIKEVTLADGSVLIYDKCIYALGSYGFIPPFKGKDLEAVTAVRSLEDVRKVGVWSRGAKSAVVIGGGVLGLEAAWELKKERFEVTVLEAAPVLMAGRIDEETVSALTRIAEKNDIRLVVGAKIQELAGDGRVKEVVLANGERIPADLVIISTGVRANIGIAEAAGLECDRAVVVNDAMETNVADVYACGDCAQYNGANITIWPVASEMGRVAGAVATGDTEVSYEPKLSGMTFAGMGTMLYAIGDVGSNPDFDYKTLEIKDSKKETLQKFFFTKNVLCGAILLGDTSKMAKVTEGIAKRTTYWDLVDMLK
ncbi:FAD-dependent oxidoreductase [Chakrabartyella piscis]|uniref:FAD-dependent oxidoreductase n=1 Tax=Chakrabartyella piscis TaxID=2918914 RepID=UPI002958BA9C|nr:FAD-dependent oxidoreductase [Chakrabartyella piscis]